jgi:hypothetical protein
MWGGGVLTKGGQSGEFLREDHCMGEVGFINLPSSINILAVIGERRM